MSFVQYFFCGILISPILAMIAGCSLEGSRQMWPTSSLITQAESSGSSMTPVAGSDSTHGAPAISELCLNGVEGSYIGLNGGNFTRVNVICVDNAHIAATSATRAGSGPTGNVMGILNLAYGMVDNGRLMLSTTPVDAADRITIPSNAAFSWLNILISSITPTGFSARLLMLNSGAEVSIGFQRDSTVKIPVLQPTGGNYPADSVIGAYTVASSSFGALAINFQIFDNMPYISVRLGSVGQAVHMVSGPAWDPTTGLISSIGVAGDMVINGIPTFYFRGRMLSDTQIQLYIINSEGVYGPYIATKNSTVNSSALVDL